MIIIDTHQNYVFTDTKNTLLYLNPIKEKHNHNIESSEIM